MIQLENNLRIKVTGVCNQNCVFCHKEGGMDNIDEINFTPDLGKFVERLYHDFNISSIAITGGEPLLHSDLELLLSTLKSNTSVKKFSLTTNGTIEKDINFWLSLKNLGLNKINVSISDIRYNEKNINSSNISIFDNQLKTIKLLNKIDIIPTINVVVYKDITHLVNLLNILYRQFDTNFNIALLPNLTNSETFKQSQNVISEALKTFGCKTINSSYKKGTSNMIYDYVTLQSHNLQIKTTKPNGHPKWLKCLCNKCKYREYCQEGFYGIRLESINNQLMVRLCLHTSNSHVLLSVNNFLNSDVYKELKTLW